jgi:hypothetical protein
MYGNVYSSPTHRNVVASVLQVTRAKCFNTEYPVPDALSFADHPFRQRRRARWNPAHPRPLVLGILIHIAWYYYWVDDIPKLVETRGNVGNTVSLTRERRRSIGHLLGGEWATKK